MADTTFVDGETLIEAAWLNDVNEAVYNPAAALIPASSIVNTPAGDIAATDVQTALNELDTEKQPLDAQLTTLAGITAQQATDLAAVSTFMGTVLNDADAATARTTLELETVSQVEAEAGTAPTTRAWTAERVAQSIAALAPSPGLGVGQAWQNMTSSRVLTTVYTNSTGSPIMVAISATGNGNCYGTLTVDGIAIDGAGAGSTGYKITIIAVVPAGGTYALSQTNGTLTINSWNELR